MMYDPFMEVCFPQSFSSQNRIEKRDFKVVRLLLGCQADIKN